MTDKELLSNAARALLERGLTLDHPDSWAPLAYDGDAFRLSVSLSIGIVYYPSLGDGGLVGVGHNLGLTISEPYAGDARAATRRALVRAAAALASVNGQSAPDGLDRTFD